MPKVNAATPLKRVAGWLEQRPDAARVRLVPLIESARGLLAADSVAAADPRNVALILGSEDFAEDMGMEPCEETLLLPKQLALVAARANALVPLGLIGTVAEFRNLDSLAELARRSRRFGFEGASCIHQSVVPVLNAAFSPTVEDVRRAQRIVDEFEVAAAGGHGSVEVDGRMVDRPVVLRAQSLLDQHARARERDAL